MKKLNKFLVILLSIVVITVAVGIFSGCNKTKAVLQGLSYDGGKLSWSIDSLVEGVDDSYKVFVNKAKKAVSVSDGKVVVDLNNEQASNDEFEVKVEADGKEVEIEETFKFKKISAFSVDIVDGRFDWSQSALEYADYGEIVYDVIVDNQHIPSVTESSYTIASGAVHTISIRPRISNENEFYFSDWSEEKSALVLSTPRVSKYSFESNGTSTSAKLNWTEVNFNGSDVHYKLWINGNEYDVNTNSFDTAVSASNLDLTDGMEVKLQAVTEKEGHYSSVVGEAKKYIKLDRVSNVKVTDGTVTFDAVKNAKQYSIRLGDDIYTSYTNQYRINISAESLYVQVRPEPEEGYIYNDRNWSDAVYFKMLQTPILRYDNGQILFDNIKGDTITDQIEIRVKKVDDEDREEFVEYRSANIASFALNSTYTGKDNKMRLYFEEEGEYEIIARAIPKLDIGYNASNYSAAFKVVRLGAVPSIEFSLVPDNASSSSYIKIKIIEVSNARQLNLRYVLKLDGVEISSSTTTEFIVPNPYTYDERTYTVSIDTVVDTPMVAESLVLDSLQNVQFTMTKLGTPRNVAIDKDGRITWEMPAPKSEVLKGSVDGYSTEAIKRYVAYIAGTTSVTDTRDITLAETLNSGEHTISVYAQSEFGSEVDGNTEKAPKVIDFSNGNYNNQSIILSSESSSTLSLLKLAYPTDIRMIDGNITWTPVEYATGYNVIFSFGNSTEGDGYAEFPCDSPSFNLRDDASELFERIDEGGCAVTVVALGNKGVDLQPGSLYSFDSERKGNITLRRLAVSTGVTVNDDYISWNSVSNAVSYEVVINGSTQASLNTSLDISNWVNGEYTIKIRAIGDDVALIDGLYTEEFKFTKLNSMKLSVKKVSPEDAPATDIANTELCDKYCWKEIVGATSYRIKIGEKEYTIEPNQGVGEVGSREYTFEPRFTVAGNNIVEYWASGSDGAVNDAGIRTISSNKVRFLQVVKKMETPEILGNRAFSISFKDGDIAITANVKDNQKGYGYFFNVGGTVLYSIDNILVYKNAKRGTSSIQVAYVGNYFEVDRTNDDGSYIYAPGSTVYYLSSDYCKSVGSLNYLNNITEVKLEGTGEIKQLTFSGYNSGARYALKYDLYKEGVDEAVKSEEIFLSGPSNQSVNVDTSICEGGVNYTIKVYVIAIGDASEKFSDYSVFTAELTFSLNK